MKRFTHIIAGLSLALSAFGASAATSYHYVKEEAIIRNVSVEPTNAGINPEARAYIIKGQVMLGSNKCFAGDIQAKLKIEQAPFGNQHVVAVLQGRQPLYCIEIYDPVYADVSITVRGDTNLVDTVFIRNVEEKGTLRPLSSFTEEGSAGSNRCEEPVICTREYRPTICTVNGVDIRGNNKCEAMANVRRYACVNGFSFQPDEVVCRAAFNL